MYHVHLWIYNHPVIGIVDQINFFVSLLKQYNYRVTVGKKPDSRALNVIIENFTEKTSQDLISFCRKNKKKVAIIMTEHLDLDTVTKEIKIHGNALWTNNDYMHPITQIKRIQYLMECLPYICSLFTLGDLPYLENIDQMLPGIPLFRLEFPRLKYINPTLVNKSNLKYDLLFTGSMTDYRRSVITLLRTQKIAVFYPKKLVSEKNRVSLCELSKIILNIPQRKNWPWLSLMRVISALALGKPTVSLNTKDQSIISSCCYQLEINTNIYENLLDYLENWKKLYDGAFTSYTNLAKSYAEANPFPHIFFEYWNMINNMTLP